MYKLVVKLDGKTIIEAKADEQKPILELAKALTESYPTAEIVPLYSKGRYWHPLYVRIND